MSWLPTAAYVELLQLLLAVVAVGLGFWRLWIAVENGLMITRVDSNDLRRLIAETQVLGELFRLFMYGCLAAVGIVSVLLPPPDINLETTAPELLQGFLTRMGLITLTVVMVGDSIIQELRRREFLNRVNLEITTERGIGRRKTDFADLQNKVQEGIDRTQESTVAAHMAYEEANSVNRKIADINEQLVKQNEIDARGKI